MDTDGTHGRPTFESAFMNETEARVIVMIVQLSRKIAKLVREKLAKGECLRCNRSIFRRLLCTFHYGQFRAALYEKPKKDRPQFEADLIADGRLGEDRQGQRGINEYREFAGK